MIETTIKAPEGALAAIRGLLHRLLEGGLVDALLVPVGPDGQPGVGGANVAPALVTDASVLDRADPLAPVLPINAARAVQQLTVTGHRAKLGAVLRSCEIRALVELCKFQQAKLENVLLIGVDCLGTYPVEAWQSADRAGAMAALLAGAGTGDLSPAPGLAFRAACQMCEQPTAEGEHVALTLGLLGVEPGRLYVRARDDLAAALDLAEGGAPPGRARAVQALVARRTAARDAAYAAFRGQVNSMDGLLGWFSTCIRCHNCMVNCPICYCRECIVRTPTFEHESELLYQWAERKGSVRLLPDTLLFHLTRLNHMVTSCVGCGLCTDACPVGIQVGTAFRAVGDKVQALFDYHPGRSLAEAAPVQEFREDELTALGERPR